MSETRSAHPYFYYDAAQEQPRLVRKMLFERRSLLEQAADAAALRDRLVFVGIGTSYHAALVGHYFLRHLTAGRFHAQVEQPFELKHYPLALGRNDAVLVISHTGTTSYSIEALHAARAAGALTIALCGENSGERMREADILIETCEQEVSFAYTKSYSSALAALALFSVRFAEKRGLPADAEAASNLQRVPQLIQSAFQTESHIEELARTAALRERLIFFGAGPNWATACEAALKVKETSYLAAEGFETEQLLHGPFSEIDSRATLVGLFAGGAADDRARAILRAAGELKAFRAAIAVPEARHDLAAEHIIEVPAVAEWLSPLVHLIPLQLLTYYISLARGFNPDTGRQDQPAHARAHAFYKL